MIRKLFPALLLAATVAFQACSDGDYLASPQGNTPAATDIKAEDCTNLGRTPVSASIDGKDFIGDSATSKVVISGNTFTLNSSNAQNSIRIVLGAYGGNRSYNFNGTSNIASVGPAGSPTAFSSANGGTGVLNLTRADGAGFEGTYYFTVTNAGGTQSKVCGGYFKLPRY